MQRTIYDLARGPDLHQPTGVHDGDTMADLANDAEVVADEEHGNAPFALKRHQQVQDLGLHGDVER
jgi:hypothetical protein